ncbi:uncharacterized protein LOC6644542 [Drosophila willistoni]|nr:uncharacterized protein LOC6644542 [Drosophila willistoni]
MDSSKAECQIEMLNPTPYILNEFGSYHFMAESFGVINRGEGQNLKLYCPNGFKAVEDYNRREVVIPDSMLSLRCDDYFRNKNDEPYRTISCVDGKKSEMFESRKKLANCEQSMTYVMGQNFNNLGSSKSLALCYDIVELRLKYIAYTAYLGNQKIIQNHQIGQLNTLGLDINVAYTNEIFQPVSPIAIDNFNVMYREVFGYNAYEYANLIQDKPLTNQFTEYEDMLSIVWLRNLRTGNWYKWLNALNEATKTGHKFDVRLGVSGELQLPKFANQCLNRTLSIVGDNTVKISVPKLIWAHVTEILPTNDTTNDIVIIGHNTPFITDEMTKFCTDKCNKVSWLKDTMFLNLRQYAAFGLVQCCQVDEIVNQLDNFPMAILEDSGESVETN